MAHNWVLYIAAFASAFAISVATTPLAKKISIKVGAIDYPKDRGMHKKPMPRMGGIAIVLGFMITVLLLSSYIKGIEIKQFIGFIIGATIIIVLGVLDDMYTLRARVKLLVQIIAAGIVVYTGTRINVVLWPFTAYLQKLSIPITMFWIIGVTNAVNLIDGLDGLAAGVSSIAALCLMVLCIITGSEVAVILTAALAGACLGFLPRNFNLGVTSILGVFKGYAILALLVSMLCLGLPVFDTLFAMGRRVVNHKPIMEADRGHLHHRLIDRGFSQRQAVLILYGISFFCGLVAIFIAIRDLRVVGVVILTVVVLSVLVYYFNSRISKKD